MTLSKTPPKRPTNTHKKRHGQHHKQSTQHYVKHYWPYLPLLLVVVLGLALNTFIGRANHSVLGYATNVSGQLLLDNTNDERAKSGEAPLTFSPILAEAAQAKANDMAARNYWSHETPDGKQPWAFIDATGYKYAAAGENLAYGFGTSAEVVAAWMGSDEHRANILNGAFQEVGFATVNIANFQDNGPATIVVAEYAQPVGIQLTATVNNGNPGTAEGAPVTVALGETTKKVSRLETVVTSRPLQITLAVILSVALTLFVVRHARAWHRVLVRGERFIVHHPFVDVFLVAAAVMIFLLTPIAGNIL